MKFLILISIILLITINSINCKVVRSTVSSGEGFKFLGKFCYESNVTKAGTGIAYLTLWKELPSTNSNGLAAYMYYSDKWDEMNKKDSETPNGLSCFEKLKYSQNFKNTANRVVWVNDTWSWSFIIRQQHRPSYWFMVLSNCEAVLPGFFDVTYEATFVNTGTTNSWDEQFSVDEEGITRTFLVFFFFTMGLVIAQGLSVRANTKENHLSKLLLVVVVFQFAYVFCMNIHLGSYISNGYGVPPLKGLGELLAVAGRLGFILLIMLIASGFYFLHPDFDIRIFYMMTGLVVSYFILLIWDLAGSAPSSTYYYMNSAPGWILFVINLAMLGWFLFTWKNTWNKYFSGARNDDMVIVNGEKKKTFYKVFAGIYSLFFLSLPITTIICISIADYARLGVAQAIELIVTTFAYGIMIFLLKPSSYTTHFTDGVNKGLLNKQKSTPQEEL